MFWLLLEFLDQLCLGFFDVLFIAHGVKELVFVALLLVLDLLGLLGPPEPGTDVADNSRALLLLLLLLFRVHVFLVEPLLVVSETLVQVPL